MKATYTKRKMITLTPRQNELLQEISEAEERPVTDIVRQAISEFLIKKGLLAPPKRKYDPVTDKFPG